MCFGGGAGVLVFQVYDSVGHLLVDALPLQSADGVVDFFGGVCGQVFAGLGADLFELAFYCLHFGFELHLLEDLPEKFAILLGGGGGERFGLFAEFGLAGAELGGLVDEVGEGFGDLGLVGALEVVADGLQLGAGAGGVLDAGLGVSVSEFLGGLGHEFGDVFQLLGGAVGLRVLLAEGFELAGHVFDVFGEFVLFVGQGLGLGIGGLGRLEIACSTSFRGAWVCGVAGLCGLFAALLLVRLGALLAGCLFARLLASLLAGLFTGGLLAARLIADGLLSFLRCLFSGLLSCGPLSGLLTTCLFALLDGVSGLLSSLFTLFAFLLAGGCLLLAFGLL